MGELFGEEAYHSVDHRFRNFFPAGGRTGSAQGEQPIAAPSEEHLQRRCRNAAGSDHQVGDGVFGIEAQGITHVAELEVQVDEAHSVFALTRQGCGQIRRQGRLARSTLRGDDGHDLALGLLDPGFRSQVVPAARRHLEEALERRPYVVVGGVGGDDLTHARAQRLLPEIGSRVGHEDHTDLGPLDIDRPSDLQSEVHRHVRPERDDVRRFAGYLLHRSESVHEHDF